MSSIIKVNTVEERDAGNGVTIDGYKLKDGAGTMVNATLQVVTQQAAISIVSDGTEVHIAGLQVTITPSSTSSAIMVGIGHCPIQPADRGSNPYWGMKIERSIGGATATVVHSAGEYGRADNEDIYANAAGYSYIDKPNTTSECVYNFYYTVNNVGSAENAGIGKGQTCTSYGIEFSGATEV